MTYEILVHIEASFIYVMKIKGISNISIFQKDSSQLPHLTFDHIPGFTLYAFV
jgi:hypothetical protein